jgi:4-diphosphocytidyl-2C-methyl-D-erythritol kinase
MQTKKMSLANIQGKLSRTEMKNIMAGSGSECIGLCNLNQALCSGTNYKGCSTGSGVYDWKCCKA